MRCLQTTQATLRPLHAGATGRYAVCCLLAPTNLMLGALLLPRSPSQVSPALSVLDISGMEGRFAANSSAPAFIGHYAALQQLCVEPTVQTTAFKRLLLMILLSGLI